MNPKKERESDDEKERKKFQKKRTGRTLMIRDNNWLISAWKANVSVSSAIILLCFI